MGNEQREWTSAFEGWTVTISIWVKLKPIILSIFVMGNEILPGLKIHIFDVNGKIRAFICYTVIGTPSAPLSRLWTKQNYCAIKLSQGGNSRNMSAELLHSHKWQSGKRLHSIRGRLAPPDAMWFQKFTSNPNLWDAEYDIFYIKPWQWKMANLDKCPGMKWPHSIQWIWTKFPPWSGSWGFKHYIK